MKKIRLTRIAVTIGAAALCFGVAAPAVACSLGPDGSATRVVAEQEVPAQTLALEKAWIDAYVARRQQDLAAFAAKVAADPGLTAVQKSAFAVEVGKAQAALTNLQDAVDAATSTAQIRAIVGAALRAVPHLVWPAHLILRKHVEPARDRDAQSTTPTEVAVRTGPAVGDEHSRPAWRTDRQWRTDDEWRNDGQWWNDGERHSDGEWHGDSDRHHDHDGDSGRHHHD